MHTVARGFRRAQHVSVSPHVPLQAHHICLFGAHGQFPFSAHLWLTLLWFKGEFHLSAWHLTCARQGYHWQAPGESLRLSFLSPKLSWVASACRGHLSLSSLHILQGCLLGVFVAVTPFTVKTSVVLTQVRALISLNFSSSSMKPLFMAFCLVVRGSVIKWIFCCSVEACCPEDLHLILNLDWNALWIH